MPELSAATNELNEGELMNRWLENQHQELQIESKRITLTEKELEHNRALSEKTIDAQLKDRSEERASSRSIIKQTFIFFGVIILMLLLFGGYVISQGKEAFLSEIIGLVIELGKYLVGAVTGFFIAKAKYNPSPSSNTTNE